MKTLNISALSSTSAINSTPTLTIKPSDHTSAAKTSSSTSSSESTSQITELEQKLGEIAAEIKGELSSVEDEITKFNAIRSLLAQEGDVMAEIGQLEQESKSVSTAFPAITAASSLYGAYV